MKEIKRADKHEGNKGKERTERNKERKKRTGWNLTRKTQGRRQTLQEQNTEELKETHINKEES